MLITCSLLVTFNLMYMWDLSLNVLSLCGLALAVGMLTDNGIVVKQDVTTKILSGTLGSLYLDGDSEDVATGDTPNTVGFTDVITVTAKALLTPHTFTRN